VATNGAAIGAQTRKLREIEFTVNEFLFFSSLGGCCIVEGNEENKSPWLFLIVGLIGPTARFNRFGPV